MSAAAVGTRVVDRRWGWADKQGGGSSPVTNGSWDSRGSRDVGWQMRDPPGKIPCTRGACASSRPDALEMELRI